MMSRLGDAYRNVGRFDDAERTYKNTLKLGYQRDAFIGLAKLHLARENHELALGLYEAFLTGNQEDEFVINDFGNFLLEEGFQEQLKSCFDRTLSKHGPESQVGQHITTFFSNIDLTETTD